MTEKRYYSVDYDEEYYIFDSNTISKEEVEEKSEYSYDVFADSLTSKEILKLLNENEQLREIKERYDETIVEWNALKSNYDDLKNENEQLKRLIDRIDEELNEYEFIKLYEYDKWKKELLND